MKVAILGTGNIGCDLLVKVMKSKYLECIMFAGQRENSPGIAFAKKLKVPTSTASIQGVLDTNAGVVFDATSADAHKKNASLLKDRFVIDLTPAKLFPICVPNITQVSTKGVSMGSCTLQAVMPRLAKIKDLEYVEVVTTVASDGVGLGTRENLSEFLLTTADAIKQFTGAKTKVILIINPVLQAMENSIYYKTKNSDQIKFIHFSLEGAGDYLSPKFGNLDVMTSAALKVAEGYARQQR